MQASAGQLAVSPQKYERFIHREAADFLSGLRSHGVLVSFTV